MLYQEPEKGTMVLPDLDNLRAVTAFVRRHAASARFPVTERANALARTERGCISLLPYSLDTARKRSKRFVLG